MSQQRPFNSQQIKESAELQEPGLLEQLNLPPALITFIRKNQRTVWIVVGIIALVVIVVALYDQYSTYQEKKANSALSLALQEEGTARKELLGEVIENFGSTDAGLWARVELAHLMVDQGETEKAIETFLAIKDDVSIHNPVTPLVLYALGVLYEKRDDLDNGIAMFAELSAFEGFGASSYEALGRLYEQKGEEEKALEMYEKALATDADDGSAPPPNPDREMIQARIDLLRD